MLTNKLSEFCFSLLRTLVIFSCARERKRFLTEINYVICRRSHLLTLACVIFVSIIWLSMMNSFIHILRLLILFKYVLNRYLWKLVREQNILSSVFVKRQNCIYQRIYKSSINSIRYFSVKIRRSIFREIVHDMATFNYISMTLFL